MSTFLICRGMEVVELDESFNNTRHRINEALTGIRRNGEAFEETHTPLHHTTFKTAEGGRVAIAPDHIIGVGSDVANDQDDR